MRWAHAWPATSRRWRASTCASWAAAFPPSTWCAGCASSSCRATSEGAGRDIQLVVKLPLAPTRALPAREHTSLQERPRRRRILLDLLELWGHQVRVAQDGLALARQAQPELALVDIGLPGLDGWRTSTAHSKRASTTLWSSR